MTEQEKRDWVIDGLEFTLEESGWDANEAYDQELMIQIVKDAIALLRAQKPRVMTLEEWKNLPEPKDGECLCYEINDGSRLQAVLIKAFVGSVNLYGKAFRCWTSRPSDEQRRNTPWT